MKIRNDYPIYLNPTFPELQELSKYWDTIRICLAGNNDILLASGYGNTHTTIRHYYLATKPKARQQFLDCYILFHENKTAYLNAEDIGGKHYDRRFHRYFNEDQVILLKELIALSGLS